MRRAATSSRRACRASSPPALSARARRSAAPPRSAKARWRCSSCTRGSASSGRRPFQRPPEARSPLAGDAGCFRAARASARRCDRERSTRLADSEKPNILVIWGDDIGITNLSCYSDGLMGYRTPNIDRIPDEGMRFTDSYGGQSCTAARASFIPGQSVFRTGLSKVGVPAAPVGLHAEDVTIAELLKPLGYATGQFGKNHLGDRNEFLPTVHGFDEFFGNLYH